MTSPSPHLDLDALADALAGEGDAGGAEHLAGCPSCASRLDELVAAETRVITVLRAQPPPAVPADLADRLLAALAAEAPLPPAAAPAPAALGASITALPAARARGRRTWLPAAAAAVLLASGAGLGVALLGDGLGGGSSSDEAATTAGGPAAGAAGLDLLRTESGADWADPAAATTVLPQLLSGGADRVAPQGPAPAADGDQGEALSVPDGLERLRTPQGLADCLSSVLPPDEPGLVPLAVDYASYAGQPALAIVLPDPDPAQLSVFVVGAGCSAAGDQTLHFLRAPRP